jgi:hypothetical protein
MQVVQRVGGRSALPSIINLRKLLASENYYRNPLIYIVIALIIG